MKLSPEEQKEKRKQVNRQYQLKNKEVLKEKRIKKRESNKSLTPIKPRLIPPPKKPTPLGKIFASLVLNCIKNS